MLPALPLPMGVFALGVFDVTAETFTGLDVLQLSITLQLLLPAGMVQLEAFADSVPEGAGAAWQIPVVVFQALPDAQAASTESCCRVVWLLIRKKLRDG